MNSGTISTGVNLRRARVNNEVFAPAVTENSTRRNPWGLVRSLWLRVLRVGRRTPRRLRLCESLPLGERRFVAVVEFEQSRFLVGGTSAALVLLARLEDKTSVIPAPHSHESAMHEPEPECR